MNSVPLSRWFSPWVPATRRAHLAGSPAARGCRRVPPCLLLTPGLHAPSSIQRFCSLMRTINLITKGRKKENFKNPLSPSRGPHRKTIGQNPADWKSPLRWAPALGGEGRKVQDGGALAGCPALPHAWLSPLLLTHAAAHRSGEKKSV